jgi:hypothetical protein
VRTGEVLAVSRENEIESKFVRMETTTVEDMDAIGTHAGISCPECHGPMWRIVLWAPEDGDACKP